MGFTKPITSLEDTSRPAAENQLRRHPLYHTLWYVVNSLLIIAILLAIYSAGWEYSTRRYLRGFSDAIVPATAPAYEKIEAILQWMERGPARLNGDPGESAFQDRDPTDTLNYEALLKVCGTATNAFINLVDSGGLVARRLLLVDANQMTKHVVAEVLADGRWIVVDPAYRVVLRGTNGNGLTRKDLMDASIFGAATRGIPRYDPSYTYDHVTHIRLARLRLIGPALGALLSRAFPGWEDSAIVTLLLERESFAAMVLAIFLVIFLGTLRVGMRLYGEKRLGIRRPRIRQRLFQASEAFFKVSG